MAVQEDNEHQGLDLALTGLFFTSTAADFFFFFFNLKDWEREQTCHGCECLFRNE